MSQPRHLLGIALGALSVVGAAGTNGCSSTAESPPDFGGASSTSSGAVGSTGAGSGSTTGTSSSGSTGSGGGTPGASSSSSGGTTGTASSSSGGTPGAGSGSSGGTTGTGSSSSGAGSSGGAAVDGGPGTGTAHDAGSTGPSSSSSGSVSDAGSSGAAATGADGGAACPSLTGPADKAYPRWPMPNPPVAKLVNPFSYTDNGNGTVTDHVTGLVWQKVVSGSATFAAAPAYCAGLTLPAPAGTTWQVPTRIQLLSIVDYTTGAAVDAPFLANGQPPGGMFTWTSTPWVVAQIATKPQDAWMVNFGGGGGLTSNAAAQTATEWIRCVAAPPVTPLPYPHYVASGAGEVRDVETGLMWAQVSNNTLMTQTAATAYCVGLGLNGHTWRLPSVNELATLVDDNPNINKVSPAIDQCVFADTSPNTYYMSSSASGTMPWGLNYEDGFDFDTQPALPGPTGTPEGFVKCVR